MTIDEGRPSINRISRRSLLRGGLLAGAGVATVGAMSAVLTGTAKASTPNPQYGWGFCHYCNVMWYTPGQSGSACAYPHSGGRHAVASGSLNYGLHNSMPGLVNTSDPQPNWSFCSSCQGLFWTGNLGVCAGNWNGTVFSGHVTGRTNYDMYFNTTGQAYWRWCTLCSLLYYQGSNSEAPVGACPSAILSGGASHLGGDTIYDVGYAGTF